MVREREVIPTSPLGWHLAQGKEIIPHSTPVPGQKKIDEMMDLSSYQGRVGGSSLGPNVSKIETVRDGGKNDKQHNRE